MIVYGKQILGYLLQRHAEKIRKVILQKEIDKSLFKHILNLNIPIERIDFKAAQALAKGGNHQGCLVEIFPLEQSDFATIKTFSSVLVLGGVSDTHNIGAIFRSAYALGFEAIILTEIVSFSYEGAVKTSSGAIFDLPFVIVKDGLSVAHELKMAGFCFNAAGLHGQELTLDFVASLPPKIALFMGSEGEGLRKRLIAKMDNCVTISLRNLVDSLNVSVAAAILMDRIQNGRKQQQ
ncbi:23S rRNA (guanosine(2251)-2'-O)-methyltransferase RlmB [Helicobacter monodelphidis]|nr:23S rRNA (guanosine(2251)-2'-O)-methyltransferase RlmB [Helicobacter sp. 15-1451]